MPISNDEFRAALGHFASGVTVVTTIDADGKRHGITVSAFTSLSLDPPLILICIEKATASHDAFLESRVFVANVLNDWQMDISERFAAPHVDKFEGVGFSTGELGCAILNDVLVSLECTLKHAYDGGDHSILVGEVVHTIQREGKPLVYFKGSYRSIC